MTEEPASDGRLLTINESTQGNLSPCVRLKEAWDRLFYTSIRREDMPFGKFSHNA